MDSGEQRIRIGFMVEVWAKTFGNRQSVLEMKEFTMGFSRIVRDLPWFLHGQTCNTKETLQ